MTTLRGGLLAAVLVVLALLLQAAVLSRLPTSGGRPDLLLVLVVAVALAGGPEEGMVVGFGAGLLADLRSDHALGMLALLLCLVGYAAGLFQREQDRSLVVSLFLVGLAVVGASLGYYLLLLLLADPRASLSSLAAGLGPSVGYALLLAPFVLPLVALLRRRVEPAGR